jgi:hypothetical protein
MKCEACGAEMEQVAIHIPGEPAESWHPAHLCSCDSSLLNKKAVDGFQRCSPMPAKLKG